MKYLLPSITIQTNSQPMLCVSIHSHNKDIGQTYISKEMEIMLILIIILESLIIEY